jgi:FlaA1/EpsC-like NDP-sugar epimerase
VLVTGAGGSIGSELSRQLAKLAPKALVLLDHSESALFEIQQELSGSDCLSVALADVKDSAAMKAMLKKHGPQVIFHAAAFKHVAMMEQHPAMAVANNVIATHQLAGLASKHGVEHFVLISTDKAVAPTCVMGASKRLAERIMEGHALVGGNTRFITVRFGNVLGSSGSVVPIFQKQIEEGGPVTVRDRELSRFFMSISEAAGLVLHSAVLGQNGDRFILDMGEPVCIADLAEQMIRLSGKTPGREIEVQFTQLLPGEKLHEELYNPSEQLTETSHPKIKRIQGDALKDVDWAKLQSELRQDEPPQNPREWMQSALQDYQSEVS